MLSWLYQLDVEAFRFINGTAGGMLDPVMLVLTSRFLWVAIGVAIFFYALYRRQRTLVVGSLVVMLTLGVADFVTYTVLKPGFDRDRPCHQLEEVNLIQKSCGSRVGFPSNHAANGMAAAVTAALFFGFRRAWFVLPVAVLVGYTRVYVGVHFPLDILFGFAAGVFYAVVCWYGLWKPLMRRFEFRY